MPTTEPAVLNSRLPEWGDVTHLRSYGGRCDRRFQANFRSVRRANTPPHFGELRFGAERATESRRSRSIRTSGSLRFRHRPDCDGDGKS
jgi:hypothetical protein